MLLLAASLAGCVETTQQKNARVQLQDDRLLASRSPVRVTQPAPNVTVLNVRMLRSPAGAAIAVTLRNDSSSPVSDLPVSVGVRTAAGRVAYLNRQPGLPYFQTHMAGVAARTQTTWVFTTARQAPSGNAFARVGVAAVAIDKGVTSLPVIASSVTSAHANGRRGAVVSAIVTNRSDVAQGGLEVYAYALSGERLVAAGTAGVASLEPGAKTALRIPVLGSAQSRFVHLEIPPTNLR